MKRVKTQLISAIMIVSLLLAACTNPFAASKRAGNDSLSHEGFAVLELFTSEGCSSCPPADALLAQIQKEAGDRPIYVLSYHVDYWDRLGWKDAFSQAKFSQRQSQYSQQLTAQVYAPQLIINGRAECVGSDEAAVNSAIKNALQTKTTVNLYLQAQQEDRKMNLTYEMNGNADGGKLLIALVQKHAVSRIANGENKGRTLSHAQIVRNLFSFDLSSSKKGKENINLPVDYNPEDWEIIGWLQDASTGVIISASRAEIKPADPALAK